MKAATWLISGILLGFFAFMFWTNWRIFFHNYIKKDSHTSVIPFLGGLSGTIGLLIAPVNGIAVFWWIPLLLDWGSVPLVVFSASYALSKKRTKAS